MKRNVLRDRKGRQKTEQNGRKKETTQERRVAAIWKNFLGVVLLGEGVKEGGLCLLRLRPRSPGKLGIGHVKRNGRGGRPAAVAATGGLGGLLDSPSQARQALNPLTASQLVAGDAPPRAVRGLRGGTISRRRRERGPEGGGSRRLCDWVPSRRAQPAEVSFSSSFSRKVRCVD